MVVSVEAFIWYQTVALLPLMFSVHILRYCATVKRLKIINLSKKMLR